MAQFEDRDGYRWVLEMYRRHRCAGSAAKGAARRGRLAGLASFRRCPSPSAAPPWRSPAARTASAGRSRRSCCAPARRSPSATATSRRPRRSPASTMSSPTRLDVADEPGFRAFLDAAEQATARSTSWSTTRASTGSGRSTRSRRRHAARDRGQPPRHDDRLEARAPAHAAARSGDLVNVASGVGRVPLPGSATYSATKHGVVGLTESLRIEYRGSGIGFS